MNTTLDALHFAETACLKALLVRWDPSEVTSLAIHAKATALVVARLAEKALAGTGSLTTAGTADQSGSG